MANKNLIKVKNFIQTFLQKNISDPNLSLSERRIILSKLHHTFHDSKIIKKVSIQKINIHQLDAFWIKAPAVREDKMILFFHGGGFRLTTTSDYIDMLAQLSLASHLPILSVDYRLAPENPFPAAFEDSLMAYEWLLAKGAFSAADIALAGMSSGGTLVLALMIYLRDKKNLLPKTAVCFSPITDFSLTAKSLETNNGKDWYAKNILDEIRNQYVVHNDIHNPYVSPLYADLHRLPSLLIQVGSNELLLDDSIHFAEKAKQSGLDVTLEIWPEMIHNWTLFNRDLPEGLQAIKNAAMFLNKNL